MSDARTLEKLLQVKSLPFLLSLAFLMPSRHHHKKRLTTGFWQLSDALWMTKKSHLKKMRRPTFLFQWRCNPVERGRSAIRNLECFSMNDSDSQTEQVA